MPYFFIVQNTKSNLERYGPVLYNSANIVNLPPDSHRSATAYFASVQEFSQGMPVRQWLSVATYEEQYEFSMAVLKNFGVRERWSFTILRNVGKFLARVQALLGIAPAAGTATAMPPPKK